jgi:putative transposase
MLSVKDASIFLGKSQPYIRTLIKAGTIQAHKVDNRYSISQVELDKLKPVNNNQRTFEKVKDASWVSLHNSDIKVLKLCDYRITRFWDNECQNLSNKLPLTGTLDMKYLRNAGTNISSIKLTPKEDMYNNVHIYAKPCLEYSKTDIKSNTLKLQKTKLSKLWMCWIKEANQIYNLTVNILKESTDLQKQSKYDIRKHVKTLITNSSLPNTSLEYAIFEAINAVKAGNAKERTSSVINVDGRCIRNGFLYEQNTKRFIKSIHGKKHYNSIIHKFKQNTFVDFPSVGICKLIYDATTDAFYINYPVECIRRVTVKKPYVALDPGIRSFLTYYDGNTYGEIGANFTSSLNRRMKQADNIETKIQQTTSKRKQNIYRKAQNIIKRKITNKVKDLHYKTINFLGQYENIFLPEFKVKQISSNLDSKNTRKLMALSHFKFKLRLATKTSEIGNRVIICNESYTSKTCTNCGIENNNLGSSKLFKCNNCKMELDRDYNGARNIALRVLTYGSTFKEHLRAMGDGPG